MDADGDDVTTLGCPASVAPYLAALPAATEDLLGDVEPLDDEAMRRASSLPEWSRGHVLTHLARNAEGSVRLLAWARSGTRQDEYPSMVVRGEDIEAGSGRPTGELVADLRRWSEALVAAAADLPPERWSEPVQWAAGEWTPAAVVPVARLGEVLLHHTDLEVGFAPARWPGELLPDLFDRYLSLAKQPVPEAFGLEDTDNGRSWTVGSGPATAVVSGPAPWLLAWLTRRSEGDHLAVSPHRPLPRRPTLP